MDTFYKLICLSSFYHYYITIKNHFSYNCIKLSLALSFNLLPHFNPFYFIIVPSIFITVHYIPNMVHLNKTFHHIHFENLLRNNFKNSSEFHRKRFDHFSPSPKSIQLYPPLSTHYISWLFKKQKQNKNQRHQFSFMLSKYPWLYGCPLKKLDSPLVTPLKKTVFCSFSR